MSEQRVVCAACRHPDGRIVCGVRHLDELMWRQILNVPVLDYAVRPVPAAVEDWGRAEQGFVDSNGLFLTREEAWAVALCHDQPLIDPDWCRGSLHSEHLY